MCKVPVILFIAILAAISTIYSAPIEDYGKLAQTERQEDQSPPPTLEPSTALPNVDETKQEGSGSVFGSISVSNSDSDSGSKDLPLLVNAKDMVKNETERLSANANLNYEVQTEADLLMRAALAQVNVAADAATAVESTNNDENNKSTTLSNFDSGFQKSTENEIDDDTDNESNFMDRIQKALQQEQRNFIQSQTQTVTTSAAPSSNDDRNLDFSQTPLYEDVEQKDILTTEIDESSSPSTKTEAKISLNYETIENDGTSRVIQSSTESKATEEVSSPMPSGDESLESLDNFAPQTTTTLGDDNLKGEFETTIPNIPLTEIISAEKNNNLNRPPASHEEIIREVTPHLLDLPTEPSQTPAISEETLKGDIVIESTNDQMQFPTISQDSLEDATLIDSTNEANQIRKGAIILKSPPQKSKTSIFNADSQKEAIINYSKEADNRYEIRDENIVVESPDESSQTPYKKPASQEPSLNENVQNESVLIETPQEPSQPLLPNEDAQKDLVVIESPQESSQAPSKSEDAQREPIIIESSQGQAPTTNEDSQKDLIVIESPQEASQSPLTNEDAQKDPIAIESPQEASQPLLTNEDAQMEPIAIESPQEASQPLLTNEDAQKVVIETESPEESSKAPSPLQDVRRELSVIDSPQESSQVASAKEESQKDSIVIESSQESSSAPSANGDARSEPIVIESQQESSQGPSTNGYTQMDLVVIVSPKETSDVPASDNGEGTQPPISKKSLSVEMAKDLIKDIQKVAPLKEVVTPTESTKESIESSIENGDSRKELPIMGDLLQQNENPLSVDEAIAMVDQIQELREKVIKPHGSSEKIVEANVDEDKTIANSGESKEIVATTANGRDLNLEAMENRSLQSSPVINEGSSELEKSETSSKLSSGIGGIVQEPVKEVTHEDLHQIESPSSIIVADKPNQQEKQAQTLTEALQDSSPKIQQSISDEESAITTTTPMTLSMIIILINKEESESKPDQVIEQNTSPDSIVSDQKTLNSPNVSSPEESPELLSNNISNAVPEIREGRSNTLQNKVDMTASISNTESSSVDVPTTEPFYAPQISTEEIAENRKILEIPNERPETSEPDSSKEERKLTEDQTVEKSQEEPTLTTEEVNLNENEGTIDFRTASESWKEISESSSLHPSRDETTSTSLPVAINSEEQKLNEPELKIIKAEEQPSRTFPPIQGLDLSNEPSKESEDGFTSATVRSSTEPLFVQFPVTNDPQVFENRSPKILEIFTKVSTSTVSQAASVSSSSEKARSDDVTTIAVIDSSSVTPSAISENTETPSAYVVLKDVVSDVPYKKEKESSLENIALVPIDVTTFKIDSYSDDLQSKQETTSDKPEILQETRLAKESVSLSYSESSRNSDVESKNEEVTTSSIELPTTSTTKTEEPSIASSTTTEVPTEGETSTVDTTRTSIVETSEAIETTTETFKLLENPSITRTTEMITSPDSAASPSDGQKFDPTTMKATRNDSDTTTLPADEEVKLAITTVETGADLSDSTTFETDSTITSTLMTLPELALPKARALSTPPPRVERILNEDGVEVYYGYSSVLHN